MRLRRATARRAHLFRPAREKAAWKRLIGEITALAAKKIPCISSSALMT
jgi:hypothetical protein